MREALKEQASWLEEGKADILGLYMVTRLHEKGEIGGSLEDYYVTFLTGISRSVRWGAAEAHGQANMVCASTTSPTAARSAAMPMATTASTWRRCARRWMNCRPTSSSCRVTQPRGNSTCSLQLGAGLELSADLAPAHATSVDVR